MYHYFLSKKLICLKGKKQSIITKQNTCTGWSSDTGWSRKTEIVTEKHAVKTKSL